MGWKIIEIDDNCFLKIFLDNLVIIRNTKIIIPISDIDLLMINNTMITLTINLLNQLAASGVCVVFCDNKHLPKSQLFGINVKKQSHKVFTKQLEWNAEFKELNWFYILKQKLLNQINLLKIYDKKTNDWENNIDRKSICKDNTESQIANLFFHQLYGPEFNRDLEIEINYLLNYGYTILTSMVSRSIIKKGLNQHISFFHGSEYSQFPLSYDIVEPFRIVIDYFVKELFDKKHLQFKDLILKKDLKRCLLEYLSEFKIKVDGQYIFLTNSIDKYVDWIINCELDKHELLFLFNDKLI